MFKTAGKESRPLLADKTSKLSSREESLKRRSAPVRTFRPGLNEAPPADKVFVYCTTSKMKAGRYEVKNRQLLCNNFDLSDQNVETMIKWKVEL